MLTFQPSPGSAKNMTYDNNGNLLTVTNSCGTTNYTWDVRNRLVGINGYKPDCSILTATFEYDAIGRRIEKTINGTTTQYVYDGLDVIQEKQGGAVTANYIRTMNIDEPLTRIKGSVVRHYVKDALGSIIALTDDSGVVKTTYTYDPFGNVTVSGEASDNPFQYTGRENDGTGLYYYRARYYSPELQRFISEDPIGLAGGINLYTYVEDNPVNLTDSLGLDSLRYHVNQLFPTIEWLNDSGFPVAIYPAYSGTPSGKYRPLPYGPYTGKHLRRRNKEGMTCGNGQGWSLDLNPNFSTDRTLLRIHPHTNPVRTRGCIGISCDFSDDLYNGLRDYFNSGHSDISVEVTY